MSLALLTPGIKMRFGCLDHEYATLNTGVKQGLKRFELLTYIIKPESFVFTNHKTVKLEYIHTPELSPRPYVSENDCL